MKEKILELRKEGKTYNEIKTILKCSKGTISYHCGDGQKDMARNRVRKRRKNNLKSKIDRFKIRKGKEVIDDELKVKEDRYIRESIRKFQKRDNNIKGTINKDINTTFTWEDVLDKFGENTHCYLSGEKINLFENSYNLDHIIPVSKGGSNKFDNLGITHKIVNTMKSNLTTEELIDWCKKILEFNDYKIEKK